MASNARTRFILLAVPSYALFALAWIFFSDQLLAGLDISRVVSLSIAKGIFFVLVTSVLLLLALRAVPSSDNGLQLFWLGSLANGLRSERWTNWLAYPVVLVLLGGALAMRQFLMGPELGDHPMLILFMLPIILGACMGGLGPGLLATVLAVLAVDLVAEPHLHAAQTPWHSKLQLLFLALNGLAVSLLSEMLRLALERGIMHRALLDAVVTSTSDAVFIKDVQGRYLLVNHAALAFVGKSSREVIGKDDWELFDEETAKELIVQDRLIMQSGRVQTHEEHLVLQNGERMVFLVTKGPVYNSAGQLGGLFGISRDVTRQKQAEQLLRDSESMLQQAQQLAGIGSWSWDLAEDRHYWSPEAYRLFGLAERFGPPGYPAMRRFFSDEGWEQLSEAIERCKLVGMGYECDVELLRADGESRWLTMRGEARRGEENAIVGLYGTMQDITERKQMAMQVKASESRLQLVAEATSDGFWDWDLRSGKVYRSPRYYEVTGAQPEEDSGDFRFFRQMVHPADLPYVLQAIEAHRRGKSPKIEIDFRLARQDDGVRWLQARGRAVEWDERGAAVRLVGNLSDITERKRADEDLRLVLNEAGDAIWVTDVDGYFIFSNPAACRLTGHSLDELREMHIHDLVAPECLGLLAEHLAKINNGSFLRFEWKLRLKKGGAVSVDLTSGKMKDGRYIAFGRDLTEQHRAEQELRDRERQLARVIAGSDQGFWDWNLKTNRFQISPRWESMLGYGPGEMHITADSWYEHLHPDDVALVRDSIQRNLRGELNSHEVEVRCRTRGGDWRWILSRGRVVERSEQGEPLMMSGTHTDITERKVFEQTQKEAAAVFDSSYEGILMVNPDGVITKVNNAFSRITGYSAEEAIGQKPSLLSSGKQPISFYEELWNSVKGHDFWRGELWNRRKNGELYAELLSISVVRDEQGEVQHYIGIFSDISQLKQHEAELDRVAHYDPLTGVPNRRLLSDRLRQAIVRANRSGKSCAVCFLDLDGFKAVNDKYGHAVGDQLLVAVSNNLKAILRGDDTLARLGGDEFVVLLSEVGGAEECMLVLDRVLATASQPMPVGDAAVSVTASIGVSLYPQDNVDPDTLLRHADQAMYLAKDAGKNRYQLFDPENDRKAQEHRQFLELLRQALVRDEFTLFYQPVVDLQSGEIISVEALIRWRHPRRGLLAPAEFLPHLSGNELEAAFGLWVLDAALSQVSRWAEAGFHVKISTNVSTNYLLRADFSQQLSTVLGRYPNVPPWHLELEIVESASGDVEQTIRVLQRCRELGVHFALDDFGTGHASLTHLRRLSVDTLKIDNSFVHDMIDSQDDRRIVEGVIELASIFARKAIAEGVETMEHAALLRRLGCRYAQGFGIARPMEADKVVDWCSRWEQDETWQQLADEAS
ncbi:PAS domain S-box protein [Pseudogulbenkiania ferrooxidans]|uniref:Diguanylate cyclase n=1 Tax=Pseudogulbenkiania ferrooxidans EGD-HP2 TaxID=1388764 RepID=A0ABN0N5A2_9NEIS|nr:PAS domain S-box protein [Pseudogulbenkiania ferrooxidans]ERE05287.1 diguanylate cyclase [Pseudogulbenkiania ferrooxidans EGD-HP2]